MIIFSVIFLCLFMISFISLLFYSFRSLSVYFTSRKYHHHAGGRILNESFFLFKEWKKNSKITQIIHITMHGELIYVPTLKFNWVRMYTLCKNGNKMGNLRHNWMEFRVGIYLGHDEKLIQFWGFIGLRTQFIYVF